MTKDITLGCRLNSYESSIMRELANAAGLRDAVIINTCAVTNNATRDSRAAVRKARRDNENAQIIVTGCASEVERQNFENLDGVVLVIENKNKLNPSAWGIDDGKTPSIATHQKRVRPIVQIQGGCDHDCTFCITTIARGDASSVSIDEVCKRVQGLVNDGAFEVVLSGVDIASWGADLGQEMCLGVLVKSILKNVPNLGRLRLSSIDPAAIDEDLWDVIEREKRLCPHLHLSIQAGDDMVLKRMKRRHKRADILGIAKRARLARPDIAICADFIAGFPTEDDDMFENTRSLIEEAALTFCHIFTYSPRKGTPAERMPQVPHDVRKRRAAALRAQSDKQSALFLESLVGSNAKIIIEADGKTGRSGHFAQVKLTDEQPSGILIDVRLGKSENGIIIGYPDV